VFNHSALDYKIVRYTIMFCFPENTEAETFWENYQLMCLCCKKTLKDRKKVGVSFSEIISCSSETSLTLRAV